MNTFQQPKITGYRQLTEKEAELMNAVNVAGEDLRYLIQRVFEHIEAQPVSKDNPHTTTTDPHRWMSIGRTNLQQGLMALTRAIAQPTSF